ncbi:hypothetical protein MMA231_00425 [Asticcacaulis sp. MM231]|uniref:hypothetical protein n=1 Tax=Asticcacaulis sp. MM231 TaxID=3157666 RepID=UPI0032D5841B
MLRAFILSLAMLFDMPVLAHAEISAADKKDIDAKVDAFMTGVSAGKTLEAANAIFLPRLTEKKVELQNLASQMSLAVSYAGGPLKWAVMQETQSADVLVFRQYVAYGTELPLKFNFVFFKTPKGWFAYNVFFSDIAASDIGG